MSADTDIAALEERVINAPTLEAAKAYHEQLDRLRARRPDGSAPAESTREAWKRGYNSGYQAGLRRGKQR